ncbi:hypothetical protein GWJ01_07240 [Proteus sp. G2618]|uniref:aspartyl protease family protein n=2 Tax=Bacteria TaxID=2 RepID=UPI0013790B8E|nr:aspartyl protease family protein [Proteus sp. G2618]NBN70899.1 hypothetical protein [Proteus sp. G2618]
MKNIIFNIFIRKNFNIMALFFIFTITGCSNNAKNDDPILTHSFKEQYVNYILVPVVIKGETYTFLLDTGSSSSIIDKRLADKFTHKLKGMPDPYKEYFSNVKTVSDIKLLSDIDFVHSIPFHIGNKYFNGGDFWVSNDLKSLSEVVGEDISGVLGVDIFRRVNWYVDNKNKTLVLYDNPPSVDNYEHCIPYGDYTLSSPSFYVYFSDETYVSMVLDTGSRVNYMSGEFIEYLNSFMELTPIDQFDNQMSIDFSGLNEKKEKQYLIKEFRLRDSLIVNQIFSENMNNSFAIGMSTLDSFEQYLISPDRMLLCYNLAKPPKPLLQKFRNINLRTFNNNIELFYNKESVLSEFNLKNGDIIISVNGVKYPKNAVLEVKNKINTLPKGQVTLSILRQNQLIEVKF